MHPVSLPVGHFHRGRALTLMLLATALGTQPAMARQDVPKTQEGQQQGTIVRVEDQALSCPQLQEEIDRLMVRLGEDAARMQDNAEAVQRLNSETTARTGEIVKNAQSGQAMSSITSGIAGVVPGGGLLSGLIGAAASAATGQAGKSKKLVAQQQAAAREMQEKMQRMWEQASTPVPAALRLQHLQTLQGQKRCGG